MAVSDTAKLIASLELQDKFSKTADTANRKLGGLESATGKAGKSMGAFGHTVSTAMGVGLERAVSAGIGLLKSSITDGIEGAQKLEDVMVATTTVLKSTKDASGQTAAGIRQMASDFEDMNSLIDDKVIQSAENMLATFTKIGPKAFEPATQAILDMNTAMGGGENGLQSTAILVGKALNDPIKGATALRRVGVSLTEQQQKQIKTLVKQNDLYGAQQIILKELGTEFGGRFAAQGKTGAAQMAAFSDSVDDLKISLAQGLLPGLGNVARALSTLFRDPATVASVSNFGKKISDFLSPANIKTGIGIMKDAFGKIVQFAKAVPWGAIGDALRIGGVGAKTILNAFLGAPEWVKTAVITGWGLNKLTGGLAGNLFGSLASGLIKGVLGMNAGVVNINAGVVNGGGGGVGGLPTGGALGPLLVAALPYAALAAAAIGVAAVIINTTPGNFTPKPGFDPKDPTGTTRVGGFDRSVVAPNSTAITRGPIPVKDVDASKQAADNRNRIITHFDRGASEAARAAQITKVATLKVGDRIGVLKTATVTASSRIRSEVMRLAASERGDARTGHSIDRQTASHTAQAIERIRAVESASRATAGNTDAIRRKNFSPQVDVIANIAFSISNLINQEKTSSYVTSTGRVGGMIR